MITPALTLEEQDNAEKYLEGHRKFGLDTEYKEKTAPTAIVYSYSTIEKLLRANRDILDTNAAMIAEEDKAALYNRDRADILKKSNIYNHALTEFAKLNGAMLLEFGEVDDMDKMMQDNVMELLEVIIRQRHSGMSISWLMGMLKKLVYMENLTPITDLPGEWVDHGDDVWQNKRNGALFSKDGGETYYDINSKGAWWAGLLSTRVKARLPKMFGINLRALYGKIHKSVPHTTARKGS